MTPPTSHDFYEQVLRLRLGLRWGLLRAEWLAFAQDDSII